MLVLPIPVIGDGPGIHGNKPGPGQGGVGTAAESVQRLVGGSTRAVGVEQGVVGRVRRGTVWHEVPGEHQTEPGPFGAGALDAADEEVGLVLWRNTGPGARPPAVVC